MVIDLLKVSHLLKLLMASVSLRRGVLCCSAVLPVLLPSGMAGEEDRLVHVPLFF